MGVVLPMQFVLQVLSDAPLRTFIAICWSVKCIKSRKEIIDPSETSLPDSIYSEIPNRKAPLPQSPNERNAKKLAINKILLLTSEETRKKRSVFKLDCL